MITVSTAALKMAQDFSDHLRREQAGKDWIVSFDWADSRAMRIPRPGGPMHELGPGFGKRHATSSPAADPAWRQSSACE